MQAGSPTRIARGELGGSRWEMASREPCPLLRPYVLGLSGYDERAGGPQSLRQFPQPYVVLIVDLGSPLRVSLGGDERRAAQHPGGFVASLGDAFATVAHHGHQRGIQVDLTPTGARRLFGLPLSELNGEVVALRDLLPAEHRTLAERLAGLPDWVSRLDHVEALLASRILRAELDTGRVDRALARIEACGGRLDVRSLAGEVGTSHKHLIALFHDQVGVPPKLLARLVRFQRVMQSAQQGRGLRWSELALAHGYYDQAHLARDVRHFTGLTPTEARSGLSGLADLLG